MHDIIIPEQITNDKDFADAKQLLNTLKTKRNEIEAQKEKVSRPLLTAIAARRAEFAPTLKKYETVIQTLTKMLSTYQTAKIAQLEAVKDSIIATNDDSVAITKLSEVKEVDRSGFRKYQVLKITDYNLIPRDYLKIDDQLVIQALKNGTKVPGAELVDEYRPFQS